MRLQSWGLPVWTLAALAFALTTGGPVPWFLAKFLAGLHLLAAAWAWVLARGLHVEARIDRPTATAGDRIQVEVAVHNESLLPVPRLSVSLPAWTEPPDRSGRPAPWWIRAVAAGRLPAGGAVGVPGAVFYRSLGPLGNLVFRDTVAVYRRGRYTLGPVVVELQEPLGIFRVRREVYAEPGLTVYPPVVPVDDLPVLPRQPFGRQRVDTRAWQDPSSLADVRPFQPGDNPKHIHWKLSAHLDELHVKEFELRATTDCFLFLDLYGGPPAGPAPAAGGPAAAGGTEAPAAAGEPLPAGAAGAGGVASRAGTATAGPRARGTVAAAGPGHSRNGTGGGFSGPDRIPLDPGEWVAGVAAGIAAQALHRDLVVAAAAHGDRPYRLPPGRGPQHFRRLLEWLVDVDRPGDMPLADFLAAQGSGLTPRSAVLVVTRRLDRRLARVLVQLRGKGHAVGLWIVQTGPEPAHTGRGAGTGASTGTSRDPDRHHRPAPAGLGAPARLPAPDDPGLPPADPELVRWLRGAGVAVHPVAVPAATSLSSSAGRAGAVPYPVAGKQVPVGGATGGEPAGLGTPSRGW